MKSKQELQIEAVKAIVSGELLLEEAMVTYNVKDKRTMLAWIKKTMPLLKIAKPEPNKGFRTTFNTVNEISGLYNQEASQGLLKENSLLKRIIALQDRVRDLEEKNSLLTRHRDLLMEKVSSLALRAQIPEKEAK
ncbi:hypothetical protein [Sphingobacterium arenae]|uniref:Transposase n=1 Tax=Sphingobacterium arenae TaxID=1280598 RepID=A0ABR7XZR1_9SPHI|nr:hypothetical protein [Sphingobacterium arenae]MBD1424511.1 hypothetical protein [Sphingobacterium arenae]